MCIALCCPASASHRDASEEYEDAGLLCTVTWTPTYIPGGFVRVKKLTTAIIVVATETRPATLYRSVEYYSPLCIYNHALGENYVLYLKIESGTFFSSEKECHSTFFMFLRERHVSVWNSCSPAPFFKPTCSSLFALELIRFQYFPLLRWLSSSLSRYLGRREPKGPGSPPQYIRVSLRLCSIFFEQDVYRRQILMVKFIRYTIDTQYFAWYRLVDTSLDINQCYPPTTIVKISRGSPRVQPSDQCAA